MGKHRPTGEHADCLYVGWPDSEVRLFEGVNDLGAWGEAGD